MDSDMGAVVLDVRRGIGPPAAQSYTFPALVTTDEIIERDSESVRGAIRAIVKVQRALRADPSLATQVGDRLFPAMEAGMIAELIERDLPFCEPDISESAVSGMKQFARDIGLLTEDVPYEQVVATQFSSLWSD